MLDHAKGAFPCSPILLPPPPRTNRDDLVGNASVLCQMKFSPNDPPVDLAGLEKPSLLLHAEALAEVACLLLPLIFRPVSSVASYDRASALQE